MDWVALSFVRGAEAADEVRSAMAEVGLKAPVIAKVERPEAVGKAVAERGAESVVLGGAVFAGLADRLKPQSPVPLVDGIAAAVRLAEMLAATGFAKPTAGSYRLPAKKPVAGLAEGIMRLYGRLPEG